MDAAFVQERRQGLEAFLQSIVRFQDVVDHTSAAKFFQLPTQYH